MHYFSIFFKKKLKKNMRWFFARLDEKHKFLGNFEEFSKFFFKKMHYFSIFYKNFIKICVTFSRVWTKNTNSWEIFDKILEICDENSIEKLNFYLFLGKVVAKNRAFGNSLIFLQQLFPVRGGGWPPPRVSHWSHEFFEWK